MQAKVNAGNNSQCVVKYPHFWNTYYNSHIFSDVSLKLSTIESMFYEISYMFLQNEEMKITEALNSIQWSLYGYNSQFWIWNFWDHLQKNPYQIVTKTIFVVTKISYQKNHIKPYQVFSLPPLPTPSPLGATEWTVVVFKTTFIM